MDTYVIPLTFPDLDTAKHDTDSLVGALHAAGMHAEIAGAAELGSQDDAGRPDSGPTTRELRVHATSADEARLRVQQVVDGQLPPGIVLLGEPTRL
jgi:hypothetical protein